MTFPVSSASHGVVHALVLISAWMFNATDGSPRFRGTDCSLFFLASFS